MTISTWTAPEIAQKLAMIRKLDAGELTGWHRYCTGWRKPFPGEAEALDRRAQSLDLVLTGRGYSRPSAQS